MKTYRVTVDSNSTRWYNEQNQPHREDGPAIEYYNGDKWWYRNGQLHREDGPAVERANGNKEWWVNGVNLTEAEFNARKNDCNGKIVEIEGKKYKLTEIK